MNRRLFLRTAGAALISGSISAVAGCTASPETAEEVSSNTTPTSASRATATESAAEGAAKVAANDGDYEFVDHGVGIVQMSMGELENSATDDTIPILTGTAENATDGMLAVAKVVVAFFDGEERAGTTITEPATDVPAGERWQWAAVYSGGGGGSVSRAVVERIDAHS